MTETPAVTVATLLTSVGSVFTKVIGWVGDVASTIAGEPILLLACVGIPLCGLGIGMFKRLLSARA
ncbi:MAG: hypothetical protein ACLUF9_06270 [Oscillospiraceae bacterium]